MINPDQDQWSTITRINGASEQQRVPQFFGCTRVWVIVFWSTQKECPQKNREERQENNPSIALSIHLWVSNDGPIIEKEVLQICLTQEIEEHF